MLLTTTVGFIGSISNAADTVPESATVCGLPEPESANDNVAVRVPLTVGLNTTLAEQLADGARLVPQVVLLMAKSPGFAPPMAMLLIAIEDPVPLVKFADWAALVDDTAVAANPSAVGDTVTLPPGAGLPVPESATICGLLLAVSDTVRVAVRDPPAPGLKSRATLQVPDAARLDPQVLLEMRKSPGSAPVTAMLLMVMDEPVPLVSTSVSTVLVEPTFTDPNERDEGLMATEPLDPPGANPESPTISGELVAESLKLSEAVRVPVVVGANKTFAVQLAPVARLDPQVVE